jgi:hypothetical protein
MGATDGNKRRGSQAVIWLAVWGMAAMIIACVMISKGNDE